MRRARQQGDELQMFVLLSWQWPALTIALQTDGRDMAAVLGGLRQVLQRIDPQVAIREATSLEDAMREVIARDRFITGLLVAFAIMALALTAVGLYALIAYSVQQRTREVGIRVALGATPAMVRTLFLHDGTRLALIGLVAGTATALAGTRLLASLLHGVKTYDGIAFGAGVFVIATTALLASWLPARRASRVDPLVALREE